MATLANYQWIPLAWGGCGGAGGGSGGSTGGGSTGGGSGSGNSGGSGSGSGSAAAGSSMAGGSTGTGFIPPLGSNDLPGDMNYQPGESPREIYIRLHEARLAADPNDSDALKRLGLVYHHQAVLRIDGMVDKAIVTLEKVMELDPGDLEAYAFLGSCYTMVARDSKNPFTKMKMVRKGTKIIDGCVAQAPKNILIRILRANNSLNLPGFLGRRHYALEDYRFIESIADDPEADYGIPSHLGDNDSKDVLAQVYYKIGRLYLDRKEPEKARSYFEKSVQAWVDSRWAEGARQALRKLTS